MGKYLLYKMHQELYLMGGVERSSNYGIHIYKKKKRNKTTKNVCKKGQYLHLVHRKDPSL